MDQQKAVLRISLTFFTILGINPFKKLGKIQVSCIISFLLILFVLVFLRFSYEKVTFALISDTFESTFTIVHVLSKFITLTVVKPTLKELLQITNKFWFPSVDSQLREEVENVLKILRMLLRSFLVFVTVVIVTFAIRPIFDDTLAISCYTPRSIPRVIFIIFNNLVFAMSAFAVGSFDMFVCAMVVLISVQFKILNRTILSLDLGKIGTRIDERKCLEKMRECVEQHNFLNTFLQNVTTVVSPALLVYFTIAPVVLCFELFFISKSSNFAEIAKSCVYVSGIVIELFFFFCLPATYLMIQTQDMINATYNSGWEKCYFLSIRKNIVIMMQRMQKETILSAGKMIPINMETCTNAFRMALSFYTSLQILDDKTKQIWEQ
ncbi:odorant receptor Or2-like [Tenebrio molitor]|uniref:odorant receptor Or2-like n=1 Tax=Tenebrio molitor TaxID=7067 RepID=UPI003624802C